DHAPHAHARQKARRLERAPTEAEAGHLLILQRAEEVIDAEVPRRREIVRRAQPRNHLAVEAARTQDDAIATHRDHEIVDAEPPVARSAGAAEELDLPRAQRGPQDDVAEPPVG